LLISRSHLLAVRARYYVPFRKGAFYVGGNGYEWLYCGDKQIKYSDSNSADG